VWIDASDAGHVIRRIRVGLDELERIGERASAASCCVQTAAYFCSFFGDRECFNLELFPIRFLLFRVGNLVSMPV
jgi:hypothetical protein